MYYVMITINIIIVIELVVSRLVAQFNVHTAQVITMLLFRRCH